MPAASPRLFYADCPFEHVAVDHAVEALRLIREGTRVCVPGAQEALETLVLLGMSPQAAREQIAQTAPVSNTPLAPSV